MDKTNPFRGSLGLPQSRSGANDAYCKNIASKTNDKK